VITQLPSVGFTGTVRANSNNFGNGAGVSSIDLRNLGLSRTLVLVDGQRHVAGDLTTNAVDVNSIPSALVDRVEVITGGASALYVPNVGSDLVTPNGVLLNANTFAPQFSFDAAGHLVPIPRRTGFNSFAFAQLPANCADCYFPDDFTQLASPSEAKGGNFRMN